MLTLMLLRSADSKRPMMGAMMDFAWYRSRCDAKILWIARAMLRAGALHGGEAGGQEGGASRGRGGSWNAGFKELRGSFRAGFGGPKPARLGARRLGDVYEADVATMAQCIRRVLASRQAAAEDDERTYVLCPAEPSLRGLIGWSPEELATFLSLIEGDMAVRGKCKKYAPLLLAARVGGSQVYG